MARGPGRRRDLGRRAGPRLVGAGSGRARDVLLRGHPLVQDGAIRGAGGRGPMHASVEHVVFHRLGPLRIGGAVFVDAARAWHTLTPDGEGLHVDVGAGLRMEVEGRTFRVDLARGGGAWIASAQAGTWIP